MSTYNYSYNVLINRLEAFAAGHYLIKRFTHGQIDLADMDQDEQYPFMHVVPNNIRPVDGGLQFDFQIMFADIPRDKELKAEYQREIISDCVRLAQDLIAEVKNGIVLFGFDVQLVSNPTIEPFQEEYKNTLTGVTFSLQLEVPWDWSACDIPATWAVGGVSTGGNGTGLTGLVLKVNNADNVVQTMLNLVNGTNITIEDNGDGSVTINSTGGAGAINWGDIGGALADQIDLITALNLKADIASLAAVAFSNDYNDLDNLPTIPNATSDLTNDSGFITIADVPAQVNADWNASSGVAQILNKPSLATVATSGSYNDLSNKPTIPAAQVNSDWNAVSGLAEILNKPTIPAAQIQSDWTQTNTSALDYIKNKPTLPGTIGDMLKSTYDTDNDGIVDFAEALKTEVRNSTGATLRKGYIVYLSGSTGNLPNAVLALATGDATSAQTFGVVYSDIANNSDGYVITLGQINTLDTRTTAAFPFTADTLVDGDVLYLSPTTPGWVTNVKPFAPNHMVYVGMVVRTHPTLGTIQYRIQNGYELDELHNVVATSPVNNDYMYYDSSTSLYRLRQLTAARITDANTVGQNLIKLANPSAISYLRINADNSVSALTLAQLKSDLGITTQWTNVIISSDATSGAANTFVDITGLSFPVTAGKTYIFNATMTGGTSTGLTGFSVNTAATIATNGLTYSFRGNSNTSTLVSSNGTTIDQAGIANAAYINNGVITCDGYIKVTTSGTLTLRVRTVTANACTIRAGSILRYQEVI